MKYKKEFFLLYPNSGKLWFLKYLIARFTYNSLNAICLAKKSCEKNKLARYKLKRKYHIIIGKNVKIGENSIFIHPQNIVIGNNIEIGSNVRIYQNVTIGQRNGKYPIIKDNVTIYPNALILGDIIVDKNSMVLAGSVVLNDVPEKTLVGGNPAKILKRQGE